MKYYIDNILDIITNSNHLFIKHDRFDWNNCILFIPNGKNYTYMEDYLGYDFPYYIIPSLIAIKFNYNKKCITSVSINEKDSLIHLTVGFSLNEIKLYNIDDNDILESVIKDNLIPNEYRILLKQTFINNKNIIYNGNN